MLPIALVACSAPRDDKPVVRHVPTCPPPMRATSGEATYYSGKGETSCSLELPSDRMVAAMNAVDYGHAAWCGACLVVTGPDAEIVVRVVDKCPRCKQGDLDLSREAFAELAPLATGRIPITWLPVPCDVQGPIAYRFKDGANPVWNAIQVQNHRYPIAQVETRDGSGAYRPLARRDDNFFFAPNLGKAPYALRVTDTRGHTIEDMRVTPDATAGSAQLPLCQ